MDNRSIAHTRWNCTYHIIFIPKYRRKIMYGELKKDLVEIIKKLCEMKQVEIIEGKVCKDHVHMYVAIPSKMSVLEFMSYLKGLIRWVFSIAWRFVDSLVLCCLFFFGFSPYGPVDSGCLTTTLFFFFGAVV